MLNGACNPMLCPNWGFRATPTKTSRARSGVDGYLTLEDALPSFGGSAGGLGALSHRPAAVPEDGSIYPTPPPTDASAASSMDTVVDTLQSAGGAASGSVGSFGGSVGSVGSPTTPVAAGDDDGSASTKFEAGVQLWVGHAGMDEPYTGGVREVLAFDASTDTLWCERGGRLCTD